MILRRKCLRDRTPKKSKVFPNKIKPRRKKTPKKFNLLVEFPKAAKAIDVLQNSVKKNVLPKAKKQNNILKYQLPKVSLNAEKYRLRNSSCGIDDLLFMTSTPNKSAKENKKCKTFGSKDNLHISVSNQKKSDDILIKVSQVQEKKKGLSISPIPLVQKVPNLRKRKKSASVSSKNLVNRQTVPLSKKRKSQLSSEKYSPRASPVKTRSRTSLFSKSSVIENSLQEKSSSFTKNCCEKSSTIRKKKKLFSLLKRTRKSSISRKSNCSLTKDSIPNKTNLTSSKSCSRTSFQEKDSNKSNLTSSKNCSFQENKGKKYHTSKTKKNIKKIGEPQRVFSKFCYVSLKRVRSSLPLKRDDLNISTKNITKKNVNSNKLSSSFSGNQFEKSRKSHRIKQKSCDGNLDISTPKTSTRSSIIRDITSKKSFGNSLNEKGNNFTKTIRKESVESEVRPKDADLNRSRTRSKVQQKRRYSVPTVKKKNNGLVNSKNSRSSNKAVKGSTKFSSKFSTVLIGDKDNNSCSIPVDDLITASFITPSTYFKTQNKKKVHSEITSTPLNKKALLKLKNKPDDPSCQEIKVPKKGLPAKGTLKRKRYIMNALKEKNEGYEDDIFESSKFHKFKETLFMDDDSDTSGMSIVTPKCAFLVTPRMPEKTPRYKDCFSPMELMKARKVAEEYIYRRNKRKLQGSSLSESSLQERNANQQNEKGAIEDPEKKKLDFISFAKNLNEKEDKSADSDEDVYFSDASS